MFITVDLGINTDFLKKELLKKYPDIHNFFPKSYFIDKYYI